MFTISHNSSWKRLAVLFLASQNLSLFGSSVTGLAIIWHVTLETSSGLWMTLMVAAAMLPQVLISLWGGVWADRYNRKVLIMAADGGIALATLALALIYMAGHKDLELLLAISAVRSLGSGIQAPAVSAVIPQLVPAAQLTRFNGINQSLGSGMQLLAPAAGGFVLAVFGLEWAFMLDVVTALAAMCILRFIPISRIAPAEKTPDAPANAPGTAPGKSSAWAELRHGLAYVWSRPLLKALVLCYAVSFLLITPAAFLTPVMLARKFGSEVWLLTLHEIAWTLGTLAGGAYIAWRGRFRNKLNIIAWSLVIQGVLFALLGLAGIFTVYLLFIGLSGLVLPFMTTAETVFIQENVEAGMMGRVFSILQTTALAAMPIAMFGFGPLADMVRIEGILLVTGALLALVGAVFYYKVGRTTGLKA